MATRLHPMTGCPKVLEALAGVPAGTSFTLVMFEEWIKNMSDAELKVEMNQQWLNDEDWELNGGREYARLHILSRSPALDSLDNFLVFGWKTLRGFKLLEEAGYDPGYGQTQDIWLIRQLLREQGISLPKRVTTVELKGLCWG